MFSVLLDHMLCRDSYRRYGFMRPNQIFFQQFSLTFPTARFRANEFESRSRVLMRKDRITVEELSRFQRSAPAFVSASAVNTSIHISISSQHQHSYQRQSPSNNINCISIASSSNSVHFLFCRRMGIHNCRTTCKNHIQPIGISKRNPMMLC